MKYIKRFIESNSNYFSLTDKYNELGDELFDLKSPNHIKLLSIISGGIDANIAERFELDDDFFKALENEYRYSGFELSKSEVIDACHKLKEEGYLK
jgi:hypothetical protein